MGARVLVVDPVHPDPDVLAEAARLLRAGRLVAFPTETVYGLGARALDPLALARVFAAKGRPSTHPLIAHVEDDAGAAALADPWSATAARIARAFWPGPLTLVVPRAQHVPEAIGGSTGSIAVRAPSHGVARALLAAFGEPIAAPSANRYQGLSPTRAQHVVDALGDAVDLVLDGGPCERGIESTVLDLTGEVPRVLRPGSIDLVALSAFLPRVTHASDAPPHPGAPRLSPGMDAKHYAPRAPLRLARSRTEALEDAAHRVARGEAVGLILRGSGEWPGLSSRITTRELPGDPAHYAREIYAALHELDALGVDTIVVEPVPCDEMWRAIADRLRRARSP